MRITRQQTEATHEENHHCARVAHVHRGCQRRCLCFIFFSRNPKSHWKKNLRMKLYHRLSTVTGTLVAVRSLACLPAGSGHELWRADRPTQLITGSAAQAWENVS